MHQWRGWGWIAYRALQSVWRDFGFGTVFDANYYQQINLTLFEIYDPAGQVYLRIIVI